MTDGGSVCRGRQVIADVAAAAGVVFKEKYVIMGAMGKAIGCFSGILGFGLLLIGIASLVILIKIGGQSDGLGALFFYIGLFVGFGGAFVIFTSTSSKE